MGTHTAPYMDLGGTKRSARSKDEPKQRMGASRVARGSQE